MQNGCAWNIMQNLRVAKMQFLLTVGHHGETTCAKAAASKADASESQGQTGSAWLVLDGEQKAGARKQVSA